MRFFGLLVEADDIMKKRIYAAIDANINRVLEGLRVCEDISRFIVNEGDISAKIKNIRHIIVQEIEIFPEDLLLDGRDVGRDPLKFVDLDSEQSRDSLFELARRNLHRSIEAMRSIEEFYKLLYPYARTNPFQGIRFSLYSIEKEMISILKRVEKRERFRDSLYAILDSSFVKEEAYSQTALRLIEGGASIIQLRMKNAPMRRILEAAKLLSSICREKNVLFIVNDYPEIASLSGADGVHLGQDDLHIQEVRKIIPLTMLVGVSTHSLEEAMIAYKEEPDYIAIGPVYDTASKYGELIQGIGVDVVRHLLEKIDIPIVSIGGLDHDRIRSLRNIGCSCFALLSYLYNEDNIEDNCTRIVESIRTFPQHNTAWDFKKEIKKKRYEWRMVRIEKLKRREELMAEGLTKRGVRRDVAFKKLKKEQALISGIIKHMEKRLNRRLAKGE